MSGKLTGVPASIVAPGAWGRLVATMGFGEVGVNKDQATGSEPASVIVGSAVWPVFEVEVAWNVAESAGNCARRGRQSRDEQKPGAPRRPEARKPWVVHGLVERQ